VIRFELKCCILIESIRIHKPEIKPEKVLSSKIKRKYCYFDDKKIMLQNFKHKVSLTVRMDNFFLNFTKACKCSVKKNPDRISGTGIRLSDWSDI
jgi:hypothetical protein